MAIFLVVLFLRFWQKLDFCFPASLLFYFPVFCFSAFCFSLLLLLCFFAWPIEEKRVRSLAWWFWWFIRGPPLPLHNHLGDLAFLLFYWNFLASGSYQPLLRLSIYQSIYLSIYIYHTVYIYIYRCALLQWNSIFLSARKAEGPVEEVAALPTLADAEKVSSFKAWGSGGRDAILGVGCSLKNMVKTMGFHRENVGFLGGFHEDLSWDHGISPTKMGDEPMT